LKHRKRWQFWLGMAISAAFLFIALRGLALDEVWRIARGANYWWLAPGMLVYFLGMWMRAWRWHRLLLPLEAVPLGRLFPVVILGYMGNNIYPARAGEFLRAYVLKKREGVDISSSLATILVERTFDGVALLLLAFSSLLFIPIPNWLQHVVLLVSLLFFGALAVFLAIAASPTRFQAICDWLIGRILPEHFRARASGLFERFTAGFSSLRSGRDVGIILFASLTIWVMLMADYWFVMQGFGFGVSPCTLVLMAAAMNLATAIPSGPGYTGTFDVPGIKILEGFGVAGHIAASYVLTLHAVLWLPITLLGFYYMWRESITWQEVASYEKGHPTEPSS